MKIAIVLLSCVLSGVQLAVVDSTLSGHQLIQDLCSSKDLSSLNLSDENTKALMQHWGTVCKVYHRQHIAGNNLKTRGLLDGLTSGVSGLFGDNSKLSTLLKAASALNKAKGVFDEVKQLAPKVHEHLQGSIQDVHDGLQELIDSITDEFGGKTTPTYF